ncbi:MAG: hypothetical protein ACLFQV_13145, partial [Vulcanimicrobiota bacterium]
MDKKIHIQKKQELKEISSQINHRITEVFGNYVTELNFSYIDLFTVLFYQQMNQKVKEPDWFGRDRLIISNLATLPSLFSVMANLGYVSWKDCRDLVVGFSKFFTNPNLSLSQYPGVDFISNSPYIGSIQALGYSLLGRQAKPGFRVFHVISDQRNKAMQEVAVTTAKSKINNLFTILPGLSMEKRASGFHFWFSMGWQLEEIRFDGLGFIYDGFNRVERIKNLKQ